ncbi:MAG: 3-deoxy-D-manno-octulosonic acid transferase, partial [Muribaculaceae bacterium]|nr:3-deoxy-D-manno-octulosonic acid transferase [Muribaculaceae bacterium]
GFYRKALKGFSKLYLQDEGSRQLLGEIGIRNTSVAGDTRFDRVTDIMCGVRPVAVLDRFCGDADEHMADRECRRRRLIFMAGSSWPADEAVYGEWLRKAKNVRGVIAPHEFDRDRLEKMLEYFSGEAVLLSELEKKPELSESRRILIIDCFGLLASAYSYADIAYVGGGFGAGLHNINEAAVYGVPVIYGPNNRKFIEAQEMKETGGGIEVTDKGSFETVIADLIGNPLRRIELGNEAGAYIQSKIGATEKIYRDIF